MFIIIFLTAASMQGLQASGGPSIRKGGCRGSKDQQRVLQG